MAQGVGTVKQITGILQTFGGMYWNPVDYNGPASYVQGGDAISPSVFGFNNTIWSLMATCSDQSDTYFVVPRPLNNGRTQWQLVWIVIGTGAEVTANTNLSGFTVRLSAIGQ